MILSIPILNHWTPKARHSVAERNRVCSQKVALWRPDEEFWISTNGPSNTNANNIDRLPVPAYTIKCHTIGDRIILSFRISVPKDSRSHARDL